MSLLAPSSSTGPLPVPAAAAPEAELYRAAFHASAVGMAHFTTGGVLLRVNARLCAITGHAESELVGADFRRSILPGDFGPQDEARRERLVREGGSYTMERRHLRKDGSPVWLRITNTFFSPRDGGPAYGTAVVEDISERKSAEAQSQRQELLLRSAEKIAGIGSWDYDSATGRLEGSDETMRILGLARADFGATPAAFIRLVHPDDRHLVRSRIAAMNASNTVAEIEYRIVRPDGAERVLLDRGAAIEVAGEATGRRAGMVIDITERREAEQQTRRQTARLSALVEVQRYLAHSHASVDELMDRIPELVLGVVHGDASVFELVDGDSMVLRSTSASVAGTVGLRFPRAESLSGEALRQGRTLHADDTEADARVALALCATYGLRSVIATVVRDSSGPIGVLKLFGYSPAMFGPADVDSVELLAEALGTAIQRRRADIEIQRSLEIQAGVARIQQEMVSSLDNLQGMMDLMAVRAHELTGAMGGAVLMCEGQALHLRAGSGIERERAGLRFDRAGSLVGLTAELGRSLRSDNAQLDARVNPLAFREHGVQSMLTAPLRVNGEIVGVMSVTSQRPNAFGAREEGTLRILAQWMEAVLQRGFAEEKVRASEAQYRLVFAANALPMWVIDEQTRRFVAVNDAAIEKYGWSEAQFLELGFDALRPPGTDASTLQGRSRHLTGGGSVIDVEISSNLVAFGEREARLMLAHDIGDRLRAEEALRALNETLESRVTERTAALELARHEAEQASRAKSAFVATMSHEIRTPMNGVVGMIDVLEQTPLAPDQARMLGLARESAQSLMAIIEDILDFSKIEAGKFEIEAKSMSLADTVRKATDLAAAMARTHRVSLHSEIDPALALPVLGDAMRLRQVMLNLVNNAIKFSGRSSGGGRVVVNARRIDDRPGRLTAEIAIEDNGVGMTAETVGRLFSPFTQADASTTRRFGGTGLGLTISRHLVELMGGAINVTSELEVGSTFKVRVSFDCDVASRPEPAPVRASPASALKVAVSHPELVLVAEDNPINQKVIGSQLKLLGYRAEIAENGREALALWRSGRFAIVITDLQMPEMDGYDLAASIRREEEAAGLPRTPIVALTANAMKEESGRCLAVGMDGYLSKPAPLAAIGAVLDQHLHHRASGTA